MLKGIRRLLKNEDGQALVLVVFSMIALLGFAAISVDYGYLAWQKRHLQNTVDAAALAAAWELPSGGYVARAEEYVQMNDVEVDERTVTTKVDSRTVRVEITKTYDTMFGKVLGIDDADVYVIAEAKKDSWYTGLLPFAYKNDFDEEGPLISDLEDYVAKMQGMIGDNLNLWGKVDNEDLKFGGALLGQFSYSENGIPYSENKPNAKVIEDKLDKSIYGHPLSIDQGVDNSVTSALEDYIAESGGEGYIIGILPSMADSFGNQQGTATWGSYVILHFTDLEYIKNGKPVEGSEENEDSDESEKDKDKDKEDKDKDNNKVYLTGTLANVYDIYNDGEGIIEDDFFIGKSSSLVK